MEDLSLTLKELEFNPNMVPSDLGVSSNNDDKVDLPENETEASAPAIENSENVDLMNKIENAGEIKNLKDDTVTGMKKSSPTPFSKLSETLNSDKKVSRLLIKIEDPDEFIKHIGMHRMLVKVNNASDFINDIKNSAQKYKISAITDLNENMVLLSFKNIEDSVDCYNGLISKMITNEVLKEPVGILPVKIRLNDNIPEEYLEEIIYKITTHKPEKRVTGRKPGDTKKVIRFEMSGLSLLKLHAKKDDFNQFKGDNAGKKDFFDDYFEDDSENDSENDLEDDLDNIKN